jgi:DHA1 family multidrug resistance protein-like MFS transporter
MRDIFRDSAAGQLFRFITRRPLASYPEDALDFRLPVSNKQPNPSLSTPIHSIKSDKVKESQTHDPSSPDEDPEKAQSRTPVPSHHTNDGITIVTWYSENDPENPHNWSSAKKLWVSFLILTYTFSVYIGSSLYTASEADITSVFGVCDTAAALGLSLYVIGYGIGPMLFSPLSEIPAIGRNPPYVITYAIFVILCVPTSLVNNFGGLLVLRLLLGFFGSPCLATGGASYGDFYGGKEMPIAIALWGGGATLAPVSSSFVPQVHR